MALPDIEAKVIPHKYQRYQTVGDWFVDRDGKRIYRVSDMGNTDFEFLVLMHEMIENHMCERHGITQKIVDDFDAKFEVDRAAGIHAAGAEPGDDPAAPYFPYHQKAEYIERILCEQLGLNWDNYLEALKEMP